MELFEHCAALDPSYEPSPQPLPLGEAVPLHGSWTGHLRQPSASQQAWLGLTLELGLMTLRRESPRVLPPNAGLHHPPAPSGSPHSELISVSLADMEPLAVLRIASSFTHKVIVFSVSPFSG